VPVISAPLPGPDDPLFSEGVRISSVLVAKGPVAPTEATEPTEADREAADPEGEGVGGDEKVEA
jgi:hypothetical protein